MQQTKRVCAPILDAAPIFGRNYNRRWAEGCRDFNDRVRRYVEATPSLEVVVLASPFAGWLDDGVRILTADGSEVATDPDDVARRFRATLDWLAGRGITALVLASPPADGRNIGRCLSLALWHGADLAGCDLARPAVEARQQAVRGLLAAAAGPERTLDPLAALCDAATCRTSIDGTFLYFDAGHFSRDGSRLVGCLLAAARPDLAALLAQLALPARWRRP